MKLGVQLYGAMDLFREDPDFFLAELKAAGYTEIEPCLAVGTTGEELQRAGVKPVWLPEEFEGFKRLAAAHGLGLSSCHVFGNPLEHREELVKIAEEHQVQAFVLNCIHETDRAAFTSFTDLCRSTARVLSPHGAELWLHNSYPEIQAQKNGKSLYEAVLEACRGELGAQVDVGWVLYAGENPVSLLASVAPALRSVHYKDIRGTAAQIPPQDHSICLGQGLLDTAPIKKQAESRKIMELVDQDNSTGDFLKDLKESARYLQSLS